MGVDIELLADCPQSIPTLAQWIYDEWGRFDPENTLEKNRLRLEGRLHRDRVPLALVAHRQGEPLGCVSIKEQGMRTHPEFTPWVGSLYVIPSERRHGLGSRLLQRALSETRRLGLETLYLWTEHAEAFYARHGFVTIERQRYLEQDAKLMRWQSGPMNRV